MACNGLEANCGHARQCVDEWQLRAEMGPEGYKPVHSSVGRFRRIPSLPPTSTLSRPQHPHSLYLPLPCVRNAPHALVFLGNDKPFSRPTLNPLPTLRPPSTNTYRPTLTSSLPITMSIRRNNVRVSFLLSDSESSFELYVPSILFVQ